ncbi:elongation factor P [Mesorhizobium sp. URHB0026]
MAVGETGRCPPPLLSRNPPSLASPGDLWSWSLKSPVTANIHTNGPAVGSIPDPIIMAKINGNEIRPGYVIEHDGGLWVAVRTNTVKPGKGGAYNQVELKNLINGTKLNERFRSAETVEQIRLDLKDFSFLYEQDDALVFMDTQSYEQLELNKDFVGDRAAFLQDGMMVTVQLYEERPIGISLPDYVTLTITEADPVVRGQTAASSYKPAVLENGIRVLVPPFIGAGERIIVDTNEITYVRRAD